MGLLAKIRLRLKGWRTIIINALTGLPAALYALYLQLEASNIDIQTLIPPNIPSKYVAWGMAAWSLLGIILRLITTGPTGSKD